MKLKDCAKNMLKVTAWFMGIYTAVWLLIWLSIPVLSASYEFKTFGYSWNVSRWLDLILVALHLNLILAGFFWIIPRVKELDTSTDSESAAAVGSSLFISFVAGLVLIGNPSLENCITGAALAGVLAFLIGITTTKYAQSMLIATGSAVMTPFLPGALGGGALNGLYAGLIMALAVFLAGMIPYAIVKPILLKYEKSKPPE